jgi:cation diffusion facilitator family transporter
MGIGHAHDHDHDHTHGGVDPALRDSRAGMRALIISLVILGITAAIQAVLVVFTGSVALLADTVHNVGDAFTASPLGAAFLLGRKPASDRFPYGLHRTEDLAGLAIVAIIFLSGAYAIYEAITRFINPQEPSHLWVLVAAGVIGFAGNELVAEYRIRVGRQIGSAALIADGQHARVDGFTSLGVVAGAVGALLGFPLADPIMGLIIGLLIMKIVWDAARHIGSRMLDGIEPEVVDALRTATAAVPGVQAVYEVRARWVGHRVWAEINIGVDGDLPVIEGHEIAREVQHQLGHEVDHLGTVVVHVDPVSQGGEQHHARAHHADHHHDHDHGHAR